MTTVRYGIKYSVIKWACANVGLPVDCLYDIAAIRNASDEQDIVELTMKQIDSIANKTHVGTARLFAIHPPKAKIELLPDFRTLKDQSLLDFSLYLRETISQCQFQTNWYREYAIEHGFAPVNCVGMFDYSTSSAKEACKLFKEKFFYKMKRPSKVEDYFRKLRSWIESLGILVFKSSYCGSNTKATLDISEFRGFAIIDDYAPLIFINGNDSFSAQNFTIIHELAHILVNQGGISQDCVSDLTNEKRIESWCNEFAAEFLVPDAELFFDSSSSIDLKVQVDELAKNFKVSSLVILRKLFSLGLIESKCFFYLFEVKKKEAIEAYNSQKIKRREKKDPIKPENVKKSFLSNNFIRSVISSVHAGSLRYTDAFKLLNIKSANSLENLAKGLV